MWQIFLSTDVQDFLGKQDKQIEFSKKNIKVQVIDNRSVIYKKVK